MYHTHGATPPVQFPSWEGSGVGWLTPGSWAEVPWTGRGRFRTVFTGPPLSPLLRRGAREKTLRRSHSCHSVVYLTEVSPVRPVDQATRPAKLSRAAPA